MMTNNIRSNEEMLPFLFPSKTLPDERFMPEIGNGHIATAIFNPYLHMNGLYNGESSASSRARIPSLSAFKTGVESGNIIDETYVLNVKEGIFTATKSYVNPSCIITRESFIHRQHRCLSITYLCVSSPIPGETISLVLENLPSTSPLISDDIEFTPTEQRIIPFSGPSEATRYYYISNGQTNIPEVAGQPRSRVSVAWYSSCPLEGSISVGPDGLDLYLFISISEDEKEATSSLLNGIKTGFTELRTVHLAKWLHYWENGRIDIDPVENFALAQALYGSFYYLLTSLPNSDLGNKDFIGLSPGGLAHGAAGVEIDQDYLGHCFWDTEMWMYPSILFFHPDQARMLIEARLRTLDQAKLNAKAIDKDGAKFPWESAFTGIETTPWPPAADYEIHITGDIAFAVRQFLYASPDKEKAVNELNLDILVEEIAAWWQSCVAYDCEGSCSLNGVMGPDEYNYPVKNSAFTNYIAKISLQLPSYVLPLIGKRDDRIVLWNDTAKRINVATGLTSDGKLYHPEFDGFKFSTDSPRSSRTVKQADVILLGYPLDMQMSCELRENDLDVYRKITDSRGPAMTWSMFAVGYLELGRKADADIMFGQYAENFQPPFGVWSEVPGGTGAVNFLTGMGGFLQSVINGYGGFRLRSDHLAFDPVALPRTTKWSIIGVKYLGFQIDFLFDFSNDIISVTMTSENPMVQLLLETTSGAIHPFILNVPVIIDREKSRIRASSEAVH